MSETRNEKDLEIERDGEKGKATWEKRVNQTQKGAEQTSNFNTYQ